MDLLRAAVRHRRGPAMDRRVAQQRLTSSARHVTPGSVRSSWSRSVVAGGLAEQDRRRWCARRRFPAVSSGECGR